MTLYEYSRQLILQDQLSRAELGRLLEPVGIADYEGGYRSLQNMAGESAQSRQAVADLLPTLLLSLSSAANPERVLVNLERFIDNAPDKIGLLRYLADNPRMVDILITLFAGSQFLAEILLRHPEYFELLTRYRNLAQIRQPGHLYEEARGMIEPLLAEDSALLPLLNRLRRFHRLELLRIGASDLLDLFDLPTVTGQLSGLADSVIQAGLLVAAHQTKTDPTGFIVLGMGKLGGGELNYSSDIDLIFLAETEAQQYLSLGQELINALTLTTGEGFLYRVDMRLRPWGRDGSLVHSLAGYKSYLQKYASIWEKQALLKARVVAGNRAAGEMFLAEIGPLLFDVKAEAVQTEVRTMKQRIEDKLRRRGRQWGQIKLGAGSIRDIEFVTQYLQLAGGDRDRSIRSRNTLEALSQLSSGGYLSPREYRVLTDGYIFMRTVEHHLQLMHYRQTHTLPDNEEALTSLARRLRFQGPEAGTHFVNRYQQHSAAIRAVYQRYLEVDEVATEAETPDILPHLVRMPAAYAATFSDADIERHARLAERLSADNLVEVAAVPLDNERWQVTIVGYDYIGELSLICGLLFIYQFNIIDGHVFSYQRPDREEDETTKRPRRRSRRRRRPPAESEDSRQKIVDVFTVRSMHGRATPASWQAYAEELADFCRLLHTGKQREAQGELAKRVANVLRQIEWDNHRLYPVDIEIDNESSERHTLLRIDAPDTIGFLYEFTNALALYNINIRRVTVDSVGNRVRDTLYVTDNQRQKITDPARQRELRVATVLIKHFTHLLPRSPNPESALMHFHQFVAHLFTRPDWADEIASLEQPEVLDRLARLLGVSDFLWKDFLRMQHANLFPIVRDEDIVATRRTKEELRETLAVAMQQSSDREETLNAFKDREMFRVDMRQIQGYITEFGQFSAELSDVAEIVVEAVTRLAAREVRGQFGLPRLPNGRPSALSVCALGKCGGRELGFASDIELMFIYAGNGRTGGPRVITTAEYYEKLVAEVNRLIQAKREGIFEVDLRLRPYGKAGSLAVSLESFQRYFAPDGDAWPYERQALVKLRPIAGEARFGQRIVALRDELLYTGQPFDVAAMRAMRERQIRHLVTAGTINVKFSPGGLVDLEYLVQGLQITYGDRYPQLRLPNTHESMQALTEAGILPSEAYEPLHEAHSFLRQLINGLRMVRGNAKDLTVPPPDSEEFAFLARRLGYGGNLAQLRDDLTGHTTTVQALNERLLDELISETR